MTSVALKAAAAAGAVAAIRGKPAKQRALGQSEHAGSAQTDSQAEWSYAQRSSYLEARERALRKAASENAPVHEERDCAVFVIGGCASGLSVAVCLQHLGVSDVVVVESNQRPGDMWRSRYHRLHLHDIIDECHLPQMPMPDSYPTYVNREQFAAYLDDYCRQQRVQCLNEHTVVRVEPARPKDSREGWHIQVVDHSQLESPRRVLYRAKQVVVANGVYNNPHVPVFPGLDSFQGSVVHSSRYTNATDLGLVGKRVLVVGFGNSGAEIMVDLCEHGVDPLACVRSPQWILPRSVAEVSQKILYRYAYLGWVPFFWLLAPGIVIGFDAWARVIRRLRWGSDLQRYNLRLKSAFKSLLEFRGPNVDIGTVDLVRQGRITVVPRGISRFTRTGVIFKGEEQPRPVDAVVMATGYEFVEGHRAWLDAESAAKLGGGKGAVRQGKIRFGKESPMKNLWFIFGRLRMIRNSAPILANKIAQRLGYEVKKDNARMKLRVLFHAIVVAFLAHWRSGFRSRL